MALPLAYLAVAGDEEDGSVRIPAVRIACESEAEELDVPRYQQLTLPAHDPLFLSSHSADDASISTLSRFLGIPLAGRRLPVERFPDMSLRNTHAAELFRNTDLAAEDAFPNPTFTNSQQQTELSISIPTTPGNHTSKIVLGFGAIPVMWALDPGPVVVVRTDGKPLHPLHVAAIVAYCVEEMRPAFLALANQERASTTTTGSSSSASSSRGRKPSRSGHRRSVNTSLFPVASPLRSHPPFAPPTIPLPRSSSRISTGDRLNTFERRREVLAKASSLVFAEFFDTYKERRVTGRPDLWDVNDEDLSLEQTEAKYSLSPEELEPKLEWADVVSPYDV